MKILDYRREIDGLRAVAVVFVILFHAGFRAFSGGFIGVDVFFVISGYLITTIILTELEGERFSILNFYERRARRILPALIFVILISIPFAWYLFYPPDMKNFSSGMIGVSLFISNIFFWMTTDYFSTANELNPLLHTWSLAVEEQYYLIFPIFLALTWRLRRRWILALLMVAFLLSLGCAQYSSIAMPVANFFLLPSRGWELLIGAFVAFYLFTISNQTQKKLYLEDGLVRNKISVEHNWVNEFASYVGFFLIIYSAYSFDKSTPYPSIYTLIPTSGTALIIFFARQETFVGRILGNKFFVGIGLVSYSAYLWHQPIFAFARYSNMVMLSNISLLLLSLTAFVLAYFSWRFIEIPFRNKKIFKRRQIVYYSISGIVFIVIFGLLGNFTNGFKEIRSNGRNNALLAQFDKPSLFNRCFTDISILQRSQVEDKDVCLIGDLTSKPSFVLYGDSHAISLSSAFDAAAREKGTSGFLVATSSCPPLIGITPIRHDRTRELCTSQNKLIPKLILDGGIKKVFLAARWTYYTVGGLDGTQMLIGEGLDGPHTNNTSIQAFTVSVKDTYHMYKKLGVNAYFVLQVPNQKIDPHRVYRFRGNVSNEDLLAASVSLKDHRLYQKVANDVFKGILPNSNLIDFTSVLCNKGVCSIGKSNHPYYKDDDHLSENGTQRLGAFIGQYL